MFRTVAFDEACQGWFKLSRNNAQTSGRLGHKAGFVERFFAAANNNHYLFRNTEEGRKISKKSLGRESHSSILFKTAGIIPGLAKFYKKRACVRKSRGASLFL
jgi:hypothetical protein